MSDQPARRLARSISDVSVRPWSVRAGSAGSLPRILTVAWTWPRIAMIAVIGVAASLRFWGISWGAPERVNLHPDEMNHVIVHAMRVMDNVQGVLRGELTFGRHTLDPVFLNYPTFFIYLTAGVSGLLQAVGLVGTEAWQVHVVGRCISAAFGAATALVAYRIASELGATTAGAILAALWVALMPLHVWESHVAVTDVMMTFWVAMTLWAALRLTRTGRPLDYVFAGAMLGLATGSKYTAALGAVPIVVAAMASKRPIHSTIKGLTLAAVVSIVMCFLVTPYSFLRFGDLLAAMAYEYDHAQSYQDGFSVPADGWQYRKYVYQLVAAWPFSLGFALYASALIGTFWTCRHFDRRRLVVLSFIAVFFGFTGSLRFTPLRYYMPVVVAGVILAGLWQGAWLGSLSRWRRAAAAFAVATTFVYTSVFVFQTTARFSLDTRVQAGRWLDYGLPPGTRILMVGGRSYVGVPPNEERYTIRFLPDRGVRGIRWRLLNFDAIEITSLIYARAYRDGLLRHQDAYDRLRHPDSRYRLLKRFEAPFINKSLYMKLDPMFEGYFVSPTIEVYGRRPQLEALIRSR